VKVPMSFPALMMALMLVLLTALVFDLILALPVMLLWNWLVPGLFHGPDVTWWEAFGGMLLCSILFKSATPPARTK